jgi:hypothetical protein
MIKGSCLCGTVRYEVSGPFNAMMSCHCSMCRKHHGAAFGTYVSAPIAGFRWISGEDALLNYQSSSQGERSSCSVCGSAVPQMLASHGLALLPAGPLEGDLGITPQAHMFVGSKAPWYTITDELPQHDEYPPEYGTPGQPRPVVTARPGVTAGSCLCGDVAFEADDPPMFMQSCHCSRCRRARGAAHGTNIFYKAGQFRWIRGAERISDYKMPEAKFYGVSFCNRCGAAMPRVSRERDIAVIPAGCLDTDPPMRPQRNIFTANKATWFAITDSLPQFSEGPPPPGR